MTWDTPDDGAQPKPLIDGGGSMSRDERAILDEIVEVLSAHPRGRGRWSVMRAIRTNRARRGRDIPHKFEDDVERAFRRHCAGGGEPHVRAPLFHRPKDAAGDVWAILPLRAANPSSSA
jgi:hypothetical protein